MSLSSSESFVKSGASSSAIWTCCYVPLITLKNPYISSKSKCFYYILCQNYIILRRKLWKFDRHWHTWAVSIFKISLRNCITIVYKTFNIWRGFVGGHKRYTLLVFKKSPYWHMDDTEESPIRRRRNVNGSMTDRLQVGFALLLFPILYVLVIYSLLTFVWSATISPLRINQLLFPKLVTSSHATGIHYVYLLL